MGQEWPGEPGRVSGLELCYLPRRCWKRNCACISAPHASASSNTTWTSSNKWAPGQGGGHWEPHCILLTPPPPPSSQAPQNCYGRLNVRCHYEAAEQRLVVAVLHAADLPPLDANGERADSRVQGPGAQQEGFLAYSPHPRSKRPLRDRGTGSSTSLPDDTQPEDAGEEPHTAPRV